VAWTVTGDFDDVVIFVTAEYCVSGWASLLACRVENDGQFTIPGDLVASMDFANITQLYVMRSRKVHLDVPELADDPAWSVRSISDVPIYWDPDAAPAPFECHQTEMEAGYVGNACQTDAECGGGCCVPPFADVYFWDGYCSLTGCSTDADCPSDGVCANSYYAAVPFDTYCAEVCTSDDDCRFPEYACLAVDGGTTVCRPNFW
jgi:hypothetical protein